MTRILARIGPKGQTVIPKPVRDELGLRPGDEVYIYTHSGHAQIEPPLSRNAWQEAFETLPGIPLPADFDVDQAIDDALEEGSGRL